MIEQDNAVPFKLGTDTNIAHSYTERDVFCFWKALDNRAVKRLH